MWGYLEHWRMFVSDVRGFRIPSEEYLMHSGDWTAECPEAVVRASNFEDRLRRSAEGRSVERGALAVATLHYKCMNFKETTTS